MPVQSRGASIPRVRASSRAVSIRTEPSRWRWSSAFGIVSIRRRRAIRAASSSCGASRAVTGRCYDSAAQTVEPARPSSRLATDALEVPLAGIVDFVRRAIALIVWLVAVIAIALGAAGVVAGLDTPAADGTDRTGRTARGDAVVAQALEPIETELHTLSDGVHTLSGQARGVLAAIAANDMTLAESAAATGTLTVNTIGTQAAAIRTKLGTVPIVSSDEAAYALSRGVRDRYGNDIDAVTATDGLNSAWTLLTVGSLSATQLSSLLANHDKAVVNAAARGRLADYGAALGQLDGADAAITQARALRDKLATSVDVSTLNQWLDRSAAYDKALRALYAALRASGGVVNDSVRAAARAEAAAKARLPPDTRALSLIMGEIGQGGMTDAAVAIEQAASDIDEALAPVVLPAP